MLGLIQAFSSLQRAKVRNLDSTRVGTFILFSSPWGISKLWILNYSVFDLFLANDAKPRKPSKGQMRSLIYNFLQMKTKQTSLGFTLLANLINFSFIISFNSVRTVLFIHSWEWEKRKWKFLNLLHFIFSTKLCSTTMTSW